MNPQNVSKHPFLGECLVYRREEKESSSVVVSKVKCKVVNKPTYSLHMLSQFSIGLSLGGFSLQKEEKKWRHG